MPSFVIKALLSAVNADLLLFPLEELDRHSPTAPALLLLLLLPSTRFVFVVGRQLGSGEGAVG